MDHCGSGIADYVVNSLLSDPLFGLKFLSKQQTSPIVGNETDLLGVTAASQHPFKLGASTKCNAPVPSLVKALF
jgi:hypothetical protein